MRASARPRGNIKYLQNMTCGGSQNREDTILFDIKNINATMVLHMTLKGHPDRSGVSDSAVDRDGRMIASLNVTNLMNYRRSRRHLYLSSAGPGDA